MGKFPSPTLIWLKEGWEAEYVSDLGPSYVLHVRGSRRTPGKLVHRVQRIIDGNHILWAVERDLNTPGDWHGHGLRPKRMPNGEVIRHAEEWLQPFHEAVKRVVRPSGYEAMRAAWLVAYLRDRGLPCPCGHASLVAHLAQGSLMIQRSGVVLFTERHVRNGIERTAREAARLIGDRVPDNPVGPMSLAGPREKGQNARRPEHASGSEEAASAVNGGGSNSASGRGGADRPMAR